MKLNRVISNERISLRNLAKCDATLSYLSWLSDPEINAFLEVRFSPPQSVSHLETFIADVNSSLNSLLLGISLLEDGRHIGNIKLGPIDWHHKTSEVGFLIGEKEQWGKGYASDAISILADYAFLDLGLARLTAGCYANNEGSRRALLKAGFLEEGRRISQWFVEGCRQDGILLGRVAPNFGTNNQPPLILKKQKSENK